MKFRKSLLFLLLAVMVIVAAYYPKNDTQKEAVLVQTIIKGLERLHYNPPKIDDDFSQKAFEKYLERLDFGRRFFTQEDIQKLKAFEKDIDDETKAGSLEFFDLSLELLDVALDKTETYYREVLATPIDFSEKVSFELDGEKRDFPADDNALKQSWHDYIKYQTLIRYYDKLEKQKDKGEETDIKTPEELKIEAREETLEMFDNYYKRLRKLKRDDRLSFFLNSVASVFDPHTTYYKPRDKEEFNIRFSGRLEGIGARLMTDGDYTKVSSIVVGGPAWQGKELEDDDVIMKVAQGEEDPVDIKGMDINDVVQLVRGDKGTEVRLTVKKATGIIQVVSIVRDIVLIEETFAKSLVLDGATEKEKIGYIYLPSFYVDFQNPDGPFCARDVKAEIEKLKEENVDGIILDLRNNGGGGLYDAVKMTGFFFEKGPVVQVKSRMGNPEILRDKDPDVQYDGPLVIMVNHNSASASEILAAALQDYGRAVIVGSKSTHGKGTVQRFVNLDRFIKDFDSVKPLGDIKLTTQKFYRVNGGSTQLKGVEPDIILPDAYHYIKTGEKEEDYAMEWTKIDPVEFNQEVTTLKNLDRIKAKSAKRVKNSPVFQKIYANAQRLKDQRDNTLVPLSLEDYRNWETENELASKKFKNMFKDSVNSGIKNLEVDLPSIHKDVSKEARNDDWIKSVSKDVYIEETLKIMHDLINS